MITNRAIKWYECHSAMISLAKYLKNIYGKQVHFSKKHSKISATNNAKQEKRKSFKNIKNSYALNFVHKIQKKGEENNLCVLQSLLITHITAKFH